MANLPRIVKLFEEIEAARVGQAIDQKVANDKSAIHDAFKNRDAEALRKIFSS